MNNKEFEEYLLKSKLISPNGSGGFNFNIAASSSAPVNRVPNIIQSGVAGNTPINVVSFSIVFRGTGGTLSGVSVPDGYSVSFGNGADKITTPLSYTPPTAGEQRVLITTLA